MGSLSAFETDLIPREPRQFSYEFIKSSMYAEPIFDFETTWLLIKRDARQDDGNRDLPRRVVVSPLNSLNRSESCHVKMHL